MLNTLSIRRALVAFFFLFVFCHPCSANELTDGIRAYDNGRYQQAMQLLQPLADAGDPSAQYTLGLIYHNGTGVKQDYSRALKWLLLAAEKDVSPAAYSIGVMYTHGQGVTSNPKTALAWYKRAARHGYPAAFHNLGVQYAQGRGTSVDYVEALAYLIVASDLGVSAATQKRDMLLNSLSSGEISGAKIKANSISSSIVAVDPMPLPEDRGHPTLKAGR